MDRHALSVFRTVVEERGFTRASRVLHLTQSAVSLAVRRLEAEAGTELLTRTRPPRPTAAGERVLAHARELAAHESLLARDLADLAKGGAGVLALGASQALTRELLPSLLARLLARLPGAVLHLETLPSRELIHVVAGGRLELGLGPMQKSMSGFTRRVLGTQRMVLFAGRGTKAHDTLVARGEAALRDLALVTSALDAPGARRGGGQLRERFRAAWEVHDLDLRMQLVREGRCIGYLPESTVAAAGLARALVQVDWLDFGVIERRFGLFHREDRELSATARILWDSARES